MRYIIYIILGLAPSIIWLLFFLKKDVHPESKTMIVKIFFYGLLIAGAAAAVELELLFFVKMDIFSGLLNKIPTYISLIISNFIGIALVEEFLKYFVVKDKVLKNSEFDEPLDAMLYMIIAALGFAALENLLVLAPLGGPLRETLAVAGFRFIGTTLLHALSAAITGYFLALSLLIAKNRFKLIVAGITIASALHGFYNFSIIKAVDNISFIIAPIILLIISAIFVSFGFKKLKKMASVCEIK